MIFHFNKASLTDTSIPSWVVKTKGETFYVKHVNGSAPWSTKETPDNPHTKGSIKFKSVDLIIENEEASILPA